MKITIMRWHDNELSFQETVARDGNHLNYQKTAANDDNALQCLKVDAQNFIAISVGGE